MTEPNQAHKKHHTRRHTVTLLGILVGVIALYFLFRETDWRAVGYAMTHVNPLWILLAMSCKFSGVMLKTYRFKFIVRTAAKAQFRWLLSSTVLGILAHAVLPIRPGNIVRAFVLGRLANVPFLKCFAMVLVDNLSDMLAVATVTAIGLALIPAAREIVLPPDVFDTKDAVEISASMIRPAAWFPAIIVLGLLTGLAIAYFQEPRVRRFIEARIAKYAPNASARASTMIEYFADGLHIFRSPFELTRAAVLTAATWGITMMMHICIWQAFGFDWDWRTPLIAQALIFTAMALPGSPAFIGPWHIAVALAVFITTPDADVSAAKAAAILNHLTFFVPVFAAGIMSLWIEHIRPADIAFDTDLLTEEPGSNETS
jgi:glycosyltransferase 2 family protein